MNRLHIRYASFPLALILFVSLGMSQTGCSSWSNTAKGAAAGGGAGAVVGGIIGKATGSTVKGAIIGAAVGGAAGAVIGRQMDKQAEELDRELENAEIERVSDPETGAEGIAIRFDNNLLFDFDSDRLRPGVQADLRDLASSMQNYPGHDAVIVGHASTEGSDSYNQGLSERRAGGVRNFLVSQGVSTSSLRSLGMGETQPLISPERNEADRELNRRVEIAIYASEEYRQEVEAEHGAG